MDKWEEWFNHYPAVAAIVRVPDGVLYQAAGYAIVVLGTALITLWAGQRSVEAEMRVIKAEIVEIRQKATERNAEMDIHIREANRTMSDVQLELLKHRLYAEKLLHLPTPENSHLGKEGP